MPMNNTINNGRTISLRINAKRYSLEVPPDETLLHLLRERLGLRGTKAACSAGECGACIVVKDEKTVNACLTVANDCDGADITTIEGLASQSGKLHPLQE